mgnify:CR=1 FL=1
MKIKNKKYYTKKAIKNTKLKNKILKKIQTIQNKIKQNCDINRNFILKNKIKKLRIALNSISMTPKEKNRNKEIKRIDLRIFEYHKEINLLDNHVISEYSEILKIGSKIRKLNFRKRILESSEFSKKITRRSPSLIRYNLRKIRNIEEIII